MSNNIVLERSDLEFNFRVLYSFNTKNNIQRNIYTLIVCLWFFTWKSLIHDSNDAVLLWLYICRLVIVYEVDQMKGWHAYVEHERVIMKWQGMGIRKKNLVNSRTNELAAKNNVTEQDCEIATSLRLLRLFVEHETGDGHQVCALSIRTVIHLSLFTNPQSYDLSRIYLHYMRMIVYHIYEFLVSI